MKKWMRLRVLLPFVAMSLSAAIALAASRKELDKDVDGALKSLYAGNRAAKVLGEKAAGVLVFPSVVKAGFLFGGQVGNGALRQNGKTAGYYNTIAGSYGLQAGVQVFGYALFFMNPSALSYLDKSDGFEVGIGPSVVVVDQGMGKSISSTTLTHDVYAFIFDQKGLMAGLGIQGSKITKLK